MGKGGVDILVPQALGGYKNYNQTPYFVPGPIGGVLRGPFPQQSAYMIVMLLRNGGRLFKTTSLVRF
jgi:hypothetical protein